ncbi:hypothetical protein L5G32_10360 [Gordonia sp. HY002]|uniref:hypothetical protein n=1 Tax=Gordonia zhenghanii TaxID=2911516 RepID=UPI001EEFEA42|nr:hypothetical protein [Gordonia zhenghanii]MCF8570670.1 hypothetical protein [Gordonia zhenghanii]MCF8607768.1 hypothetical protein [Gordonia zhenghanii]
MTYPGAADGADRDEADYLDAEIVESSTSPDFTPNVHAPTVEDVTGYTESGVPTFDFVRDKIEHRTATADGGQVLSEGGREAAELDDAMAKRDEAAKSKLDEIRKSMGL